MARNYNEKYNTDFNITQYFTNAFVKRNGLVYRTLHGESKTASNNDISGFSDELTTLYHNYDIKDIFNLDETGVFLKNSGNKTYVMDKKDSKNIKQQKTRLTVMLGINELNEKLPLLIVGKSRNPRCLKGINVLNAFNTYYYFNKTSWLTREIFENYIFHLNLELLKTQRKILIFLDNFAGHYIPSTSNIEFVYLPANTKSILQPLDQGIISVFKRNYKSKLNDFINFKIIANDLSIKNAFLSLDLRNVIAWIKESFEQITPECAKNCWNPIHKLMTSQETQVIPNGDEIRSVSESANLMIQVKMMI